VERDSLLINGQFPGPTIQADYGDTIQVTVRNHIDNPDEGVALHWHGLLQTGTPWEDGVPAVGQCPSAYTLSFVLVVLDDESFSLRRLEQGDLPPCFYSNVG